MGVNVFCFFKQEQSTEVWSIQSTPYMWGQTTFTSHTYAENVNKPSGSLRQTRSLAAWVWSKRSTSWVAWKWCCRSRGSATERRLISPARHSWHRRGKWLHVLLNGFPASMLAKSGQWHRWIPLKLPSCFCSGCKIQRAPSRGDLSKSSRCLLSLYLFQISLWKDDYKCASKMSLTAGNSQFNHQWWVERGQ